MSKIYIKYFYLFYCHGTYYEITWVCQSVSVSVVAPTAAIFIPFLRATAVPAGTAEARISYGDSVCLSVCPSVRHNPVPNLAQVR